MPQQSEQSKGLAVWFALLTGVAVVSTAALLIRWALQAGAAPMEIAAARLFSCSTCDVADSYLDDGLACGQNLNRTG